MTTARTIGEILRTQRQHHNLSLADLARKTRIKQKYLTALEDNQFTHLPSSVFVKGYIKSYGQIFGFDHRPLFSLLRRDFKESAQGTLIPREFITPLLRRNQLWTPVTATILLLAGIFLTLGGYIGFQYYQLQQPPRLAVNQPSENQVVAPQLTVSGQSVSDAVVSVNSQVVRLDAEGNFSLDIFLPKEGLNSITVESTDRRGKKNVIQRTVRVQF